MLTVKNAVMSPRMERLWTFIRQERRIELCDWSTDVDVERQQAALREGEAVLVKRQDGTKALADLLVDYRTIMNRRPHGRVDAASLAAEEKRALAARAEGDDGIAAQVNRGRW